MNKELNHFFRTYIYKIFVVMFTNLNLIEILTPSVEEILIDIDRKKYYPFFRIAEEYASKNSLIVCDYTADYYLLDKPIDSEFNHYEFYSDNAVKHARELATQMFNDLEKEVLKYDIDIRLIKVITKSPNKEMVIFLEDRELVSIKNLSVQRGIYIVDVVLTKEVNGLFSKNKLQCISPEHQLIDVYNILADPSECESWPEFIKTERILREQVGLVNQTGDKGNLSTGGLVNQTIQIDGGRINIDKILDILKEKYIPEPGHVLIGTLDRLQIITMYSLEDEEKRIKKMFEDESVHIEYSINYPHVPTEQRIRKLTVYIVYEKLRKPIIDIFDTGTYSLISFNIIDHIRYGTLFVIAKHLLIDIWIIRYIRKRGQINQEYHDNMIKKLRMDILKLFESYDKHNIIWIDILPINPDNYLGHYEDPDLAEKRLNRKLYAEAGKKYYDYYPYLIAQKDGENDEKENTEEKENQ